MPTRDDAPLGAPCWVDLMTSDQAGARAFYGELFGWTSEEPNQDFGGYTNFSKDGVLVAGCFPSMGDGMPDVWSVYLATDDAAKTVERAEAAGGTVISGAMAVADLGTMAVLADPSGAVIGTWQPGIHRGFGVIGEPGAPAWFELHTRDHRAAVEFYRTVFDWDAHLVADTDEFRYTTLGEGDEALAGVMDARNFLPEGVPSHWTVYFQVDDADATLERIVALGGAVVMPAEDTPYGRLAVAGDPTGAQFRLLAR
ncbi:MAG TPA: VOC family protein [Ilumatobacteraceae bacterium]